jgi:hypothetical protein
MREILMCFNCDIKPDSEDLNDWVLNWDRLRPEIKNTLELLKEQYGAERAVDMYAEMQFMDALSKKIKRDEEYINE